MAVAIPGMGGQQEADQGTPLQSIEQIGSALQTLSASIDKIGKEQAEAAARLEKVEKGAAVAVQNGTAGLDEARAGISTLVSAVLQAAREDDPEKREAAIKAAMFHGKDDKEAGTLRDDKKEDERSAALERTVKQQGEVIQAQQAEIAKPRLEYLSAAYEAIGAPDEMRKAKHEAWASMSLKELDAEVASVRMFAEAASVNAPNAAPASFEGAVGGRKVPGALTEAIVPTAATAEASAFRFNAPNAQPTPGSVPIGLGGGGFGAPGSQFGGPVNQDPISGGGGGSGGGGYGTAQAGGVNMEQLNAIMMAPVGRRG